MALLSNVGDAFGASISWLREGREGPRMAVASVVERLDGQTPFEIEVQVCCMVCGTEMLVSGNRHSWVGRKVKVRLDVAPICLGCVRENGFDADRWQATLRAIVENKPKLQLVRGDGDGDGVRRGTLRLVRVPADDE
jgi:hypothetical protein